MNDALKNVMKKIRFDTFATLVVALIMVILSGVSAANAIRFGLMPASQFTVQLVSESDGRPVSEEEEVRSEENMGTSHEQFSYALFVNGECYMPLNYNDYHRIDADGKINPQPVLVINYAVESLSRMMTAGIFFVLYLLFREIRHGKSPFTRKSVRCLRIAAFITILLGLVPEAIRSMANVVFYQMTYLHFNLSFLFVVGIGAVLGMIGELFNYGAVLQDDMDQIA